VPTPDQVPLALKYDNCAEESFVIPGWDDS
jgi:hypothetical protein